jgi:hypothetical protein
MSIVAQQPQATPKTSKLPEPGQLFSDPDPPPIAPTFPAHVTRRVRAHLALPFRELDVCTWDDALTANLLELIDAFAVERSRPSIPLRCQTLHSLARAAR